jgi:hypothetical protein
MENETEPRLDPRPLLLKRMVWDVFPHDADVVREVQSRLGLVPDGAEGLEVEHRASDTRINRVAPLGNALETLSGYAAEVMGQYLVAVLESHSDDEVELPEGFHDAFATQNSEIIYDSTYAIICHLMDTGVLAYGPKVRG